LEARKVVIAGCGYLGEAAAGFFLSAGWRVCGLCGSDESAKRLEGLPFPVMARDISQPLGDAGEWRQPDLLIHCASSGRGGEEAYRAVYLHGLKHLIAAYDPGKVLFTGSTSVYAQVDGGLVTEESVVEPDRATGRILLEAEAVALVAGGTVARLSGIYGPGRSVLLRKFLEGTAVLEVGGGRWINQIHRDDAARALVVLGDAPAGIYNVSDNTPATQRDVYGWIAGHLGRPMPPEGPADIARKRGWTSKRVDNARLLATGWAPIFPSYREALPDLVGALRQGSQD
jgi:nucleoside-diphosphate-sugar epimerase